MSSSSPVSVLSAPSSATTAPTTTTTPTPIITTTTTTTTADASTKTTTTASIAVDIPVNPSDSGLELMDAKEPQADSPIPVNASAEIAHDSNKNSLVTSTISDDVYPISTPLEQGAQQPRSCPQDVSLIQESLGGLNLGTSHTAMSGEPSLHKGISDLRQPTGNASVATQGNPAESATSQNIAPSQSEGHVPGLVSRDSEHSSVTSDCADSSPVIVVSSQSQSPEPFADQLKPVVPMLIDEPDERLLNALETPRDRLFVIRLEHDVINFIQDNICDVFDLPPINAYQRLLAHKMAEYYRLTHIADATGASVRFYRGQHARIPPIRLGDKPTAALQLNSATNGSAAPMKIMRRTRSEKGSDTPPEHRNSNTPKKPSSETSSGDGSARTGSREEREEAYKAARERIFKDFVVSPPETPPPTKQNDKQRRQEQPDDFSGRSQFFPVLSPPVPAVNPNYYPQYENPGLQFQNPQMPIQPRFNPNTPSFNPNMPNFNPPNNNFAPQPYIPATPHRPFQTPNDRFNAQNPVNMGHLGYPQPHHQPQPHPHPHHQPQQQQPQNHHHQQQQQQLQLQLQLQSQSQQQHQHQQQHQQQHHQQHQQQHQPQHQQQHQPQHQQQHQQQNQQQHQHQQQHRNNFFDQPNHFNSSGPSPQQQHNAMANPPFTNSSRFVPQQPSHNSPHHPTPPVPASGNRHPYNAPSNYAVNNNNITQHRFPQSGFGWNPPAVGGVPMSVTRSQPGMQSFDRNAPSFGGLQYQAHQPPPQQQQQPWGGGGASFGRGGYGGGGGVHGPVGGM